MTQVDKIRQMALTDSMRHSVHENIAPTIAKFLAYDIPLCPMSLSTSLAVGVLRGSLGSSPTLESIPAVKTPKAPPNTNPAGERNTALELLVMN